MQIDTRLDAGDVTLVRDIQHVTISNKKRSFTLLPPNIVVITIHLIILYMIATLMRCYDILEIVITSQISKMMS